MTTQRAYKAVFFDLDGTLLPMDTSTFLKAYFQALTAFVSKRGMDADRFGRALNNGIKSMAKHESGRLNSDVFWETFEQEMGGTTDEERAMVNEFYETEFGTIGRLVKPNPEARRAIDTLKAKGYQLFLTTMPMFPRRAVEWRLEWAGIDPSVFDRITTYDISTAVKPNLDYYRENLEAGQLAGEDVLMVGNNTLEDLAAMQLGMDAYLVTDHLLNPNEYDVEEVKHGSMKQFAAWVDNLPECRR